MLPNVDLLLEVDEAVAVLDKDDQQELRDKQDDSKKKLQGMQQFVVDYTAARKAWRATVPEMEEPRPTRRKTKTSAEVPMKTVIPFVTHPELGIPQKDMKAMLPPGAHVWRDNIRGAWAIHLPPWRRLSIPFWLYGEMEAGLEALREAWRLWCRDNDKETSACNIVGLFPAVAGSASGSSDAAVAGGAAGAVVAGGASGSAS